MKQFKNLAASFTGLFFFTALFAQNSEDLKKADIINYAKKLSQKANFTPFGTGNIENYISNVTISSNLKDNNAKMELEYNDPKKNINAGVSLTQKVDKETTQTSLLDLQGLTPGTTLSFSLQFGSEPEMDDETFNTLNANFKALNQKTKFIEKAEGEHGIIRSKETILNEMFNTPGGSKMLLNSEMTNSKFIRFQYFFTRSEHSFITDSSALSENTEMKLAPSVSIAGGLPLTRKLKNNMYLSFRYTYSVIYNNSDKLNLLVPFGTTANYLSREVNFGAPVKKTDNILNAEVRANVGLKANNFSLQVGIAPNFTLGLSSDILSFVVPVYLINGKDKIDISGLQGGFKVGYATSTKKGETASFRDGFLAQVIVAVPFKLFTKEEKD